ncbi:MAG: hypothetical protein ABDH21_03360 [bacterium]
MDFYLGWSKNIERKFKSDYKLALVFDKISFYPVNALLKLYLIKDDERIEVNSVEVFKNRVRIENEEQALDFVRMFTEPELHVFFDLLAIEVFKSSSNPYSPYGSIEDQVFDKLGLVQPIVRKIDRDFVISRTLLFYPDSEGILGRRLCIVRENLKYNGEYVMEIAKEIAYDKIESIRMPVD